MMLYDSLQMEKAPDLMNKFVCDENNWTLRLAGDMDASTSAWWVPDIVQKLERNQAQLLVIDLAAVENVDAYGLRLLLTLKKELFLRNIDLELRNPSPALRRLFRILRFENTFVIKKAA